MSRIVCSRGRRQARRWFESPATGSKEVVGKDVYGGFDALVIAYRNHRGVRAAETLWFGDDGRVVTAAACHADAADV